MRWLLLFLVAACSASPSAPHWATSFVSLDGWQPVLGAEDGDGPPSRLTLDDGAVKIVGDATTRKWSAIERPLELPGQGWIRVSFRMRGEGLDPREHRLNAGVYLKSPAGVVATPPRTGTFPWETVARRFPDPGGPLTLGLFVSMPGTAWFDDLGVERVPAPAWQEAVSGHYRYRWLAGDAVPDAARAANDRTFEAIAAFLEVPGPAQVTLVKFPDLASKSELTGQGGNANMSGDELHTIFATDRHEIVHLLARAWGDPPALVAEGLAVMLSGSWQGQPVVAYARTLGARWIPLAELVESVDFRARPDLVTYAEAGAFMSWVLATRGKPALRTLYGELRNNQPGNRERLEAALGAPVDQLDADLRAWVQEQK